MKLIDCLYYANSLKSAWEKCDHETTSFDRFFKLYIAFNKTIGDLLRSMPPSLFPNALSRVAVLDATAYPSTIDTSRLEDNIMVQLDIDADLQDLNRSGYYYPSWFLTPEFVARVQQEYFAEEKRLQQRDAKRRQKKDMLSDLIEKTTRGRVAINMFVPQTITYSASFKERSTVPINEWFNSIVVDATTPFMAWYDTTGSVQLTKIQTRPLPSYETLAAIRSVLLLETARPAARRRRTVKERLEVYERDIVSKITVMETELAATFTNTDSSSVVDAVDRGRRLFKTRIAKFLTSQPAWLATEVNTRSSEALLTGTIDLKTPIGGMLAFRAAILNDPVLATRFAVNDNTSNDKQGADATVTDTMAKNTSAVVVHDVEQDIIFSVTATGLVTVRTPIPRADIVPVTQSVITLVEHYVAKLRPFYTQLVETDELKRLTREAEKQQTASTKRRADASEKLPKSIFGSRYSVICPTERSPRLVSASPDNDPESTMTFPKSGDDTYTLSCTHNEEAKYIGLRTNTTVTKTNYPLIPCCFKKPQTGEGTLRTQYYSESDPILPADTTTLPPKTRRIIATNKFLTAGIFGILPESIETAGAGSIETSDRYFRYGNTLDTPPVEGVDTTLLRRSTLVECVLNALSQFATDTTYIREETNIAARFKAIQRARAYLGICRGEVGMQENYDLEPAVLAAMLRTENLCTRRFVAFVEHVYKVDIIVIGQPLSSDPTPPINLLRPKKCVVVPRRSYGLIAPRIVPGRRVVVVYEHTGGVWQGSDLICELVVRGTVTGTRRVVNDVEWSFAHDDPFVVALRTSLADTAAPSPRPIPAALATVPGFVKAQVLSRTGKCVGVQFFNDVVATLPYSCAPLNVVAVTRPRNPAPDARALVLAEMPALADVLDFDATDTAPATGFETYKAAARWTRRLFELVYLAWCHWLVSSNEDDFAAFAKAVLKETIVPNRVTVPRLRVKDNAAFLDRIFLPKGATRGVLIDLRRRQRLDAGFSSTAHLENAQKVVDALVLPNWFVDVSDYEGDNVFTPEKITVLASRFQTPNLVPGLALYDAAFAADVDNEYSGVLADGGWQVVPVATVQEAAALTTLFYGQEEESVLRDTIVVDTRRQVSKRFVRVGAAADTAPVIIAYSSLNNTMKCVLPRAVAAA